MYARKYMICSFKNNRLSGYSFMKSCRIIFPLIVLMFFSLFSGSLYAADRLIEKVIFHGKDGNRESVVFHLNGPWLPKAFALKGDNPRVVFDFMDTRLSRSVPLSIDTKGTMIRKIRTGRHSNKSRVVLDLATDGVFSFDQQFDKTGNVLTIQLFSAKESEKKERKIVEETVVEEGSVVSVTDEKPTEQEVVAPAPLVVQDQKKEEMETVVVEESPVVAEKKATTAPDPLLVDVSFENTSSKGEMILFKLNGFYPPTVRGKEDGTPLVVCTFTGTRLGQNVVKEQLIQGEYIQRVSIKQMNDPELIEVTMELVPDNNYDLQQVFFKEDNLFVVIVNTYDNREKSKE